MSILYLLLSEHFEKRGLSERPLDRRTDQPSFHHTRGQNTADQLEQPLVGHSLRYQPHQDIVIDLIKEFLQIQIDHNAKARPDEFLHEPHRQLDEAVKHRRNAEQANPARRFRYLHPPNRLRHVGAAEKP